MPSWHDDDCDCAECAADEDRFWREQGEGGDRAFDVSDVDDDDTDVGAQCVSHEFNADDECDNCGAPYDPVVHGHRIVPEDDRSW